MNRIVIDNYIISKFMDNGVCINPINLVKKEEPMLNIDLLPKITYGSKIKDNSVLSQLSSGILEFEDIVNGKVLKF
jgi:hypothetical protein